MFLPPPPRFGVASSCYGCGAASPHRRVVVVYTLGNSARLRVTRVRALSACLLYKEVDELLSSFLKNVRCQLIGCCLRPHFSRKTLECRCWMVNSPENRHAASDGRRRRRRDVRVSCVARYRLLLSFVYLLNGHRHRRYWR